VGSDGQGNIPTTTGTVREGPFARPDGTYDVCFASATDFSGPTAPLRFTVGTVVAITTTTAAAPAITTTTAAAPAITTTTAGRTTTPGTCSIAPSNGAAAITAAIAACPDGSAAQRTTVRFPANATYTIGDRIDVLHRNYLTIDLNGSTIRNTHSNDDTVGVHPNLFLLSDNNVTVRNGSLVGNFPSCGPRNLQTLCGAKAGGQSANAGVAFYGGSNLEASYLNIREVFGDGVLTGLASQVDGAVPTGSGWSDTVAVHHNTVTTAARMCYAAVAGKNLTYADNTGNDCWYAGMDFELEGAVLQGVHILRNTLNGFNLSGIEVPAFGNDGQVRDVEIRGNTYATPQDQCNWGVLINYWRAPNAYAYNIVIDSNTIRYRSIGISAAYMSGGAITNNSLIGYPGCGNQPMSIDHAVNVTVAGNTFQ
jgi:hypothetical protein